MIDSKIMVFLMAAAIALAAPGGALARKSDHGTTLSDASHVMPFQRVAAPPSEGLHGSAFLDYDNDGDLDVYMVNGPGFANALFRNDGGVFADVSAAAGVAGGSGNAGASRPISTTTAAPICSPSARAASAQPASSPPRTGCSSTTATAPSVIGRWHRELPVPTRR